MTRDIIVGFEGGPTDVPEGIVTYPVQLVTIKSKTPLFKGEEQANAIEKIELIENGFSLVSQKDLYEEDELAIYIQPDYSLCDIPLFESFLRPFGEAKKSKLGSNYRIRAVKFNLHSGDNEPTYSVGILLPLPEVLDYVNKNSNRKMKVLDFYSDINSFDGEFFTRVLGITKWEEPDNNRGGGGSKSGNGREFPSGIYKTDESNICNLWGHLENKIQYPVRLIGSQKNDGSSISLIFKNGNYDIASRNLIKYKIIEKVVGHKTPNLIQRFLMLFGYKPNLLIKQNVKNDDDFITLGEPYVEKVIEYYGGLKNVPDLIFRGEATGQKWKGSGNKNNPSAKLEPNIRFFGIDDYSSGVALKVSSVAFYTLTDDIVLDICKVVFDKEFSSREELEKECKNYFKDNLIEGIVVRSEDSKFSAKYMNDEYDSKK